MWRAMCAEPEDMFLRIGALFWTLFFFRVATGR